MANQTINQTKDKDASKDVFDIKALLRLADVQTVEQSGRKANTCRLYESGRINIADGSGIKAELRYTAKLADNTLIIFADKDAKRKANIKTDSKDVLFNLTAAVYKRKAYQTAVANSKVAGNKEFKDYTINVQELDGVDYYIINLAEHAPKTEPKTETKQ